ncbi:cupin domain-containing protein, partial [Candidatus Bathyarchaeota archaeon]|nr:cupin domain-containing protein [Candidatus Bathyarchaeota archaeon]
VGYLVLEAKSRTKPNIHPNSEEAFYITKGKGIIKVNNEARNVEKGDVIFIPKNVWHEFENTEDEPMEWVLIISPPPSEEEYKSSPWKIEE